MSILKKLVHLLAGEQPKDASSETPVTNSAAPQAELLNNKVTQDSRIGSTEPTCPYCGWQLEKRPSRKKKCPNCGKHMYVRTRPQDRVKVVVTEEQAELIDEQWVAHYKEQELAQLVSRPGYEKAAADLRRSMGRDPTAEEVKLELSMRDLARHRMERDWGLYRNSKLQIADALLMLGKTDASLRAYLEVCYLDMNGPENLSGLGGAEEMPEISAFNLNGDTILAPGVLAAVNEVKHALHVDLDQLRVVFLPVAIEMQRDLDLPLSPESAWSRLAEELPTAFDPADESTRE